MSTTAHENMLWFTKETKEDINFLKELGLLDNAAINTEDTDAFYEPGIWKNE